MFYFAVRNQRIKNKGFEEETTFPYCDTISNFWR